MGLLWDGFGGPDYGTTKTPTITSISEWAARVSIPAPWD
jgi:hypothetical protein